MSDEIDTVDDAGPDQGAEGPVAGERLAIARREQQIAVLEIAKELHLDEYKVRALERNDFDVIGAPVFAKGHLRKYAQLVNVDEADVMADYYQLERSGTTPLVISAHPKRRRELSAGRWLVAVVALIALAVAYWWFAVRADAPLGPATGGESSDEQSVVLPPQGAGQNGMPDSVDEPDEPATESTPQIEAERIEPESVEPEPQAVAQSSSSEPTSSQPLSSQPPSSEAEISTPPPASTETRLSLTYSGDCWSEITDASGRRLFFDLGKAGRTVRLAGEAPFNVLFGNANNVSIVVDGVPFEIPAANRRGRTARLTITGS